MRPGNAKYNNVMPVHLALQQVSNTTHAYDPRWNKYILDRITGHFTGTTDEIFQWAAAKWGLPDDLIRTIAYMESGWRQSNYGDYRPRSRAVPGRVPGAAVPGHLRHRWYQVHELAGDLPVEPGFDRRRSRCARRLAPRLLRGLGGGLASTGTGLTAPIMRVTSGGAWAPGIRATG